MSKKILKRSLALGALMAFVITGSAFAEKTDKYLEERTLAKDTIDSGIQLDKKEWGIRVDMGGYNWTINNTNGTGVSTSSYGSVVINNGKELNITAQGNGISSTSGITLQGIDSLVIVSEKDAIKAYSSTTINVDSINLTSNTSNGIYIENAFGAELDVISSDKIVINAAKDGIKSTQTAKINVLANEIEITADTAGRGAITTAAIGSAVNVTATGKAIINGDIKVADNSTTSLTMNTADSILTGAVVNENGTANLTLNKGATWVVDGDSKVTTLAGNDANVKVDMVDGAMAKVTVVNELAQDANVNVSGTGNVADYIAKSGNEEKALADLANSVKDSKGAIDTTVTTDEGMVAGAYTATITTDAEGNTIVNKTEAVNTKSDAVSDAGMTMKGHWRAHMNDMNKRMGELRMANGEAGVWTRMVRGESEYEGAKMQYNQYQLGYDEKLSVDKRWTVGAAVTFAEGDGSYGQGSTDDKSTAFAIYGSKLNNDGTFVDLIARYAHLESDMEDSVYGNGDYSTNGYSVSAEFGKRIQQGNGLWIEPQVELTYGTVDSADVAFSKSYKAHYDSMDSFITRAGFALGKDIKQGNVYARASYLYDFDGETETQFEGGKAISEDFGGGWWEVGVGANINLSKATYIYADLEKTFGGEVDTNWQWNLGVRYSF